MNCRECREDIQRWLTAALEGPDATVPCPSAVWRHAQACPDCRRRLQTAWAVVNFRAVSTQPAADLADRIKMSVREHAATRSRGKLRALQVTTRPPRVRALVGVAAAAALVITLGLGMLLGRSLQPNGAPTLAQRADEESQVIRVEFRLEAPDAQVVAVVGDWNEWDATANPLRDPDGDGIWEATVTLRPDREYQYQFLIDESKWIPDPRSPLMVDDGFGGSNSVLSI
jgi:hypothetical protein